MEIIHNNHYQAYITDGNKEAASAGFYCDSTLDEITLNKQGVSDLYLAIGLDIDKYRNPDSGSYDFQEEYARKVAQMVYEMMLVQ